MRSIEEVKASDSDASDSSEEDDDDDEEEGSGSQDGDAGGGGSASPVQLASPEGLEDEEEDDGDRRTSAPINTLADDSGFAATLQSVDADWKKVVQGRQSFLQRVC